jgi:hypothetical protein
LWFFLEYPHYDMMSGPRPEMNYQKHAWEKGWHWKVHDFDHLIHFWNPQSARLDQTYEIQIQFLVLLSHVISISNKTSAHRVSEKTLNSIQFSCILTVHQLTIRDFLQKTLTCKNPKIAASTS